VEGEEVAVAVAAEAATTAALLALAEE